MNQNQINILKSNLIDELERIDELSDITFPYDFSETIQISSLALLKMLRHGRAGVPIEVMGLMIGKYTDSISYIDVSDVFAMPQTGTGVSVEAIDSAFQTKMLDLLLQIDILDTIVGWYHSHPGFGCWLSGVDINTQQSFEQLNQRSIAVVIDPIQSIKGKIIIEAFRLYPVYSRGQEIREITSVKGYMDNYQYSKDDHGLNKYYYSLNIVFKINIVEKSTFSSIYEKNWSYQFCQIESNKYVNKKFYFDILKEMTSLIKKINIDESIVSYNTLTKEFGKKVHILEKMKKKIFQIIDQSILFCIKQIIMFRITVF